MVRVQHTRDERRHYVFGREYEFPAGERVVEMDAERALEAVASHPLLELAAEPPIPTDYDVLRGLAQVASTDALNGNSEKARIVAWLDGLAPEERAEVLANADLE